MSQKITKPALSLKQFMLRQEVLKLYRDIFRTIRKVPNKNDQEYLKDWARHDFHQNRNKTDETDIKILMQHGRRSLTELKTSLNLSDIDPTEKPINKN